MVCTGHRPDKAPGVSGSGSDYAQLARDYGEVYQKYPDTPAGEEAFLYQIRLSLPTADADRARKNLEDIKAFLQSHPKTPFLSPLYTLMAEAATR
jgi:hypothetical protein